MSCLEMTPRNSLFDSTYLRKRSNVVAGVITLNDRSWPVTFIRHGMSSLLDDISWRNFRRYVDSALTHGLYSPRALIARKLNYKNCCKRVEAFTRMPKPSSRHTLTANCGLVSRHSLSWYFHVYFFAATLASCTMQNVETVLLLLLLLLCRWLLVQ